MVSATKRNLSIVLILLMLAGAFLPFLTVFAATDAQVDAWLAARNLPRNADTLRQAYAAFDTAPAVGQGIADFILQLKTVINYIVPFLVGLAVFIIIYGILGYITNAQDEEKRKQARDFILWGVIGVFVMISIWGLVAILVNTFNLDNSGTLATDIYGKAVDAGGQAVGDKSAVLAGKPTTLVELITRVNVLGSYLLPFLIGIGVFIVIFGILNYIRQGENEEKRADARMFIIWGVVSIFIMLSIWGFVNILVHSFQLDNTVPKIPPLPTLPV